MVIKEVVLFCVMPTAYCMHFLIDRYENVPTVTVSTQALVDKVKMLEDVVLSHSVEMIGLRRELMNEMDAQRKKHSDEISSLSKIFQARISTMQQECDSKVSRMKDKHEHRSLEMKKDVKEIQTRFIQKRHGNDTSSKAEREDDSILRETASEFDHRFLNEALELNTKVKREGKPRSLRQTTRMVVAFLATLNTPATHLGTNQDIIFDRVLTNIGNAYDASHGIFRAPVGGVYVFSTTVTMFGKDSSHFGFVRNTEKITTIGLQATTWGDHGSNTIVIHLNQGDDISVQHYDSDKSIWGSSHSMMSGFLLAADDGELMVVGK